MRGWVAALLPMVLGLAGGGAAHAISGGHPATGQEFGFVRYLDIEWPGNRGGTCTGSLIGPRHVLTAAHCVVGTDGRPARSIEVRRKKTGPAGPKAASVHVHAGYKRHDDGDLFFLRNDVAVLVLKADLEGPYGVTPLEYMWRRNRETGAVEDRASFLRDAVPTDIAKTLDSLLSRDEEGRPYAAQVGFGLFGCDRLTRQCSKRGSTKARYIEKYIFNYRTDRPIVRHWCDPGPFSFSEPGGNLICSTVHTDHTRSPTTYSPFRIYTAQPGDSGGPAVVFDREKRPFVIGTMSYGGLTTMAVNMNLVQQFEFLRDVELGSGKTLRTISLR